MKRPPSPSGAGLLARHDLVGDAVACRLQDQIGDLSGVRDQQQMAGVELSVFNSPMLMLICSQQGPVRYVDRACMKQLARNGLRYPIAPYGIQADVRAGMGVSYGKK